MKASVSLSFLLLGMLSGFLMQPANAQLVDVDVADPLNLFDGANNQFARDSEIMQAGHCLDMREGAGFCDTGCDGGCDAIGGGSCRAKCECCWCRETLFGDCSGYRSHFADHGITYSGSFTQFYQGVVSGGANETGRYGGKFDSFYNFDSEKLGLWKGGTLLMHTETGYGENSILDAAGMAPVNTAFLTPRATDLPVYAITSLFYEHELGEGYAATFGRYSLLDFWNMLYPDYGRGLDGFMNTSSIIFLNIIPTLSPVINAAGLIKAGDKGIEAAVVVLDRSNVATVSGLGDLFNNGTSILGAYRVFTEFGGLPGSHLMLGIYNTGKFTEFETNGISFHPGQGITFPEKRGSWFGGYVGQQTLWQDHCDSTRRVWLQTALGWADEQTSPYNWAGTFTIESIGLNPNRKSDRMGIGYFYSSVSDDLEDLVNGAPLNAGLQDLQGGEFYYNAEVTPWFHVTGDVQVIQTEIASQDTAIVLGARAKVDF